MPKQLTTHNASLTTVAVEVKALTVSGKQVTLSVFRQLQEEPVISSDGTLNGVPWGYVNYHPDRCSDESPHWHIVWQQGDQLRRSRVTQEPRWPALRSQEFHHYLNARVLSWALSDQPDDACPIPQQHLFGSSPRQIGKFQWVHPPTGVTFAAEAAPAALALAAAAGHAKAMRARAQKEPIFADNYIAQAESLEAGSNYQASLSDLRGEVNDYGRTLAELMEDVCIAATSYMQRQARHRMVRAGLAQLPQLFIAV